MSRRGRTGPQGQSLTWRAEQLEEAVVLGGEQLDPEQVQQARGLLARVRQRWALKGGRTVVALAGATGSGKSSLFNALVGRNVATIGARRPTTAVAMAAVWGAEESDRLLDWLDVRARYQVTGQGEGSPLDGLVLIDLPDVDSREVAHHHEADRILERVDVFVWVTDPQKYADARLHDDYLAELQGHDPVMLVVLNQVDRIAADAVGSVKEDLRRLVAADGVDDVAVIPTSARTQQGVAKLREEIGTVVAERAAAERRLVGDLRATARALGQGVAAIEPQLDGEVDRELVDALSRAAGIPVVLEAVRRDYQRRAVGRAGWPLTRWVRGLRPDPLKRLRLGDDRAGPTGIAPSEVRTVLGRSSLPAPSPAARSSVQLATRKVGERAADGLPLRWAEAVTTAATPDADSLADALDQAVMSTPLRARDPWWWSALGGLQALLVLCAVVGALWLGVLAVLGWLQLDVDVPVWGPVPVPLLLLVGGLGVGLLLGGLVAVLARVGARRRRRLVAGRLDRAVTQVAREHVRRPVEEVLQRHRQTRLQLQAAAG